ncbi:hypothetical protein LLE87_37155, partial [Paenibacillus polymyxa]|nr:hypothetical protein [Paenibacillus polymyxa]
CSILQQLALACPPQDRAAWKDQVQGFVQEWNDAAAAARASDAIPNLTSPPRAGTVALRGAVAHRFQSIATNSRYRIPGSR